MKDELGGNDGSEPDLNAVREAARVARSGMSEDRRKEIALMIVGNMIAERGLPPAEQLRREAGSLAKKLNVEIQELMDFCESFIPQMIGRTFGYDSVSVTTKGKRV